MIEGEQWRECIDRFPEIPAGVEREGNSRATGRFRIDFAVANIECRVCPATQQLQTMKERGGVRFQLRQRVAAYNSAKKAHESQLTEDGQSKLPWLVRANTKREPGSGKLLERVLDARIRPSQIGGRAGIVIAKPVDGAI